VERLAQEAEWCRRYAAINSVGLRKIIKKHDKRCANRLGYDFLQARARPGRPDAGAAAGCCRRRMRPCGGCAGRACRRVCFVVGAVAWSRCRASVIVRAGEFWCVPGGGSVDSVMHESGCRPPPSQAA